MNRKHPLYKERLRVEDEISKLEKIQYNQGWIELDVPYKSGYYKTFDLRDDIKNRQDAWVFYECIRLVGGRVWWKNKTFKNKVRKGKYEYIYPELGLISEKVYDGLHPAVKKYFSEISWFHKRWNPHRKQFACRLPSYYFVDKIEPRWITHYKETDFAIVKQIDEKEDYIRQRKFWTLCGWRGRGCAPKDYCQERNRSDRAHNKRALHKNIKYGGEFDTYEYRYNHRHSAAWDYW